MREASSDPRIVEATTVPSVFTVQAATEYVTRLHNRLENDEAVPLAIAVADSGEALGFVSLMRRPQAGVAGIGYWVVPRARCRGLATRGVRLLSEWALATAGMTRVEAWVEPDNLASLRVLAAAGFKREGLLRSFLTFDARRSDAVVLSRTHQDLDG